MRRWSLTVATALVALAAGTAACDTVTDLSEVRMEGTWDGVGALQAKTGGFQIDLIEAPDRSFGGTWRVDGTAAGPVALGVNQDGEVTFTLLNFNGTGTAVFTGRLTHAYRMEGTIEGYELDGPAVFRKGPNVD